ncbi:PP2C family protein-serine/threonine phosphatase [Streptomyces sp. DH24]|uniref:PP2C family protein-serine/threonine phosphatase n=1 Tax=Streptomyces sp. DH24 TaxID=3040123 RepID=UPI002442F5B6|nr:PP2C family protein-serine/threonine phosphatase [Streptomyces sp. DH24]MDG9718292.1 PP2C family protein-serine/threonine phosphatase [Streptomyces sp. DH24]
MIRIRSRARPATRRSRRRLLALGLPTAWGAVAITYKLGCPLAQQNGLGARVVTSAVFFAVGTGLVLHVRRVLLREVRQARRVAGAAQRALLRPLPPRIDGLRVAAAQLSADRGASIGGDLYEVIPTEQGVRVVMGDVRGHGLAAASTAAAVLGSFREAVHDETDLGDVLRRLQRALARHLREHAGDEQRSSGREPDTPVAEEFVTLLLLEIRGDGTLHVLNCGHPWPYLLGAGRAVPLAASEPLPPLGPFPLPAELPAEPCGRLRPGDALFLHTDGAEEARDDHGRFFPLADVLTEAVRGTPVCPQTVLRTVLAQLLRHTGKSPADDVALLVLRNDRCPHAPHAGPPVGHRTHRVT